MKFLNYMYKDKLVTKIWYDSVKRFIRIENYTDNPILRAFGVNENPSYKDFDEFLESRCMPKSRYDLKIVLKELDLPCWDPWILIRFNHGLMYCDYNWIMFDDEDIKYEDIKIRD